MRLPALFFLLCFLPLAAFGQGMMAALQSPFESDGHSDMDVNLIQVEATGKTAEDAKAAAIRQGARDAFEQLANQLFSDDADDMLARLTPAQIEGLVQSRVVLNEKTDGTHYQGVLNYHFNAQKIAALPKIHRSAVSSAPKKQKQSSADPVAHTHAVLLLPVLKINAYAQLWEDENSWRKSWNHVAMQIGRGQIVVPYGDRRDREEINLEEALKGDFKDFAPMAQRYGVEEVYVAVAEYQSIDLSQGVQVQLRKLSAKDMTSESLHYNAKGRETREQQLERVAMELARRLTRLNGVAPENYQLQKDNEISVHLVYEGMKDYQKLVEMLKAIPSVRRVREDSVSYYEGDVTLFYRTSPEMLGKSFAAKGFRIYKEGDTLMLALPR
jgi:hypothetical protein